MSYLIAMITLGDVNGLSLHHFSLNLFGQETLQACEPGEVSCEHFYRL